MNPLIGNPDNPDDVEARVRRALSTEAQMVNPAGDGLGRIRAGIDEQGRRAWWRNPALALAAAAVVGLAAAGGTAAWNNRDGENVVASDPTPSASASATTASASPTPSPSETSSPSEAPAAPVALPIYYLGNMAGPRADDRTDDTDLRLYREFHAVPLIDGDRIHTALTEMFSGKAKDPDYSSLWPKDTKVNGVTKSGDVATIDLNRAATRANLGAQAAHQSVQQLVYTVTAADTSVEKVRITIDGRAVAELWGHVALASTGLGRVPAVDVQGLIWLLSPKEGEKVGRTVQVKGVGTAFEATISWDVRTPDGKLVKEGFTEGGANGEFAEFSDQVTLAPGTYVMRAFESSAEDGQAIHVDDKTFTVE